MKWLLMFFLAAGAAVAQVPGMFPWWDSPVARDLNLSEDQNSRVKATVREYRSRLIQLRADVETAEGDLQDQMNEDPVDVRKANETIDKAVTARGNLMRAVSEMSLKLRTILTAKQWQELQKRQPRGPGFRGGQQPPQPPHAPGRGPSRMGRPGPPGDGQKEEF